MHCLPRVDQRCAPCLWTCFCTVIFLGWALLISGYAQPRVTTNITADDSLGTAVSRHGKIYDIDGGTIKGQHLLHSFGRFRLGTGDTARFNGPRGVANILSRVTGGDASHIDGKLTSSIQGVNLFLLNPSGILFGPQATLDIDGSFYVSTANELRSANGIAFYVDARLDDASDSLLRVAAPQAFGFLQSSARFGFTQDHPAGITIDGSSLRVSPGKTLSVLGGNLAITDATLEAPSGQLHVVSAASTGTVRLNLAAPHTTPEVERFARLGDASFSGTTGLDVSAADGNSGHGTIVIRGGRLAIDRAELRANTPGNVDGAETGVDLLATERVDMTHAATITTVTTGGGDAGRVTISAPAVHFDQRSTIKTTTRGPGRGGAITVRGESVTFTGASLIDSHTIFGGGTAGAIHVEARQVHVTGGAQINSNTSLGGGRGGTVAVTATDTVLIAGGIQEEPSLLSSSTSGLQDAGSVSVTAPTVRLENGGQIKAAASRTGHAGAIDVRAEGGHIHVTQEAAILSTTSSKLPGGGMGGEIRLTAQTIDVSDEARISAESTGTGKAGSIELTATGTFRLTQAATIRSTTALGSPGGGEGGEIRLTARTLEIRDQARVSAESTGTGNAGSIHLTATDTFLNDHGAVSTRATQAQGGAIQVTAQNMVRLRQGEITTEVTRGDERAGNITIDPEFVVLENSQIIADAVGGPGGNITITAGTYLADPNTLVTASSARSIDGQINIQAPVQNLSGVVAPLPQDFVSSTVLLSSQCAARLRQGAVSSLVTRGPEGIPASPQGVLPGRYDAANPAPRSTSAKTAPHPGQDAQRSPRLQFTHAMRPENQPRTWQLECLP
jgi:filamentous hemagglutinin family protein